MTDAEETSSAEVLRLAAGPAAEYAMADVEVNAHQGCSEPHRSVFADQTWLEIRREQRLDSVSP